MKQAPVTLANGSVVTPIATIAPANGAGTTSTTLANGSVVAVAAQSSAVAADSVVVVSSNSAGQLVTATIPYESALAPTGDTSGDAFAQSGLSGHKSTNVGMIAGPVAAVLIIVLAALAFLFVRRRRRTATYGRRGTLINEKSDGSSDSSSGFGNRFRSAFSSRNFKVPSMPSMPSMPKMPSMPSMPSVPSMPSFKREKEPMTMFDASNNVAVQPVSAMTYIDRGKLSPVTRPIGLFGRVNKYGPSGARRSITSLYRNNSVARSVSRTDSYSERGSYVGGLASPRSTTSTPLPALTSINDALNSGELVYDDDASSLGHGDGNESQGTIIASPSGNRTRTSFGTFIMVEPSLSEQGRQREAAARSRSPNPFNTPDVSPQLESDGSPQSMAYSFTTPNSMVRQLLPAGEDLMSNDTFGVPRSPTMSRDGSTSSLGIVNMNMRSPNPNSQDVPLYATAGAVPQPGSMMRFSPYPNLSRQPAFNAIVEEDGIPDDIKNNIEVRRRGSFLSRRSIDITRRSGEMLRRSGEVPRPSGESDRFYDA